MRSIFTKQRVASDASEADLEELVEKTCAGDDAAWQALWPAVAAVAERAVTPYRVLSRLSASEDERSDVVVRVMGELRRDDFRHLAELGERLAQRDGSWVRWLSKVAINTGLKHVRDHAEYLGEVEGGGGRWANHTALSETQEDEHPDPTRDAEAHRILTWAREHLPAAQVDALVAWLHGADPAEPQGAGDADEATRLMRAAVQRLRREFAPQDATPCPRRRRDAGSR